jgi:hypothetical protein
LREQTVLFPQFIATTWLALVCAFDQVTAAPASSVPEHQRILSAYGWVYRDLGLHAALTRNTTRLSEVSSGPDFAYSLAILNSPAVNAFALPNCQLCVTRGQLALAGDRADEVAARCPTPSRAVPPWQEHARRNDPVRNTFAESSAQPSDHWPRHGVR